MWPFKEALSQRKPVYISDLGSRNTGFEVRGWPEEAVSAVLIPILTDSDADPQAVFVFGLNPRRPWSESEAQFFQLLSKSLSTGISSTKLYEDAAAKALSLQQLDHQKSTFYSNISHELRQPLQLILGPLEDVLTSGNATDPAVREPLKMVTRHAQRLLRLVNSLLDFSQLEAGRTQPRLRPADIGAVTKDLASLFRSAIERGKIEYIVDCPPSPSPVWVDLEIFEKIVFNVLGNAFKYTSQGQISVHIEYTKETFLLHISDTGSGIPEDSINHIFERFYRVEQNTSRTFEGTGASNSSSRRTFETNSSRYLGIGLALTAELVKTMGGSISVQSQLGVGSTFTIKLPRGTKHVPKGQLVEQASDSDFGSMPNRLQCELIPHSMERALTSTLLKDALS